ncbi:MAG: AAA family ATPase [Actinobacteria bacterium]|nr:AAA family ATPase [Actinomycetota bacterium]
MTSHLPPQPTHLLGRESDLETVRSILCRDETRLLTLTGPAGVGKTRLAVEVGGRMSGDFAQGVVFVDLSLISDPAKVPQALAQGAGLQDVESPRLQERLFAYLRERRDLIILDNFEQVLGAASWLADLLARCTSITLLVTSREPLHLRWEQTYRVAPLPLSDPDHLPPVEELARVPAVALFLVRTQALDSEFALGEKNARNWSFWSKDLSAFRKAERTDTPMVRSGPGLECRDCPTLTKPLSRDIPPPNRSAGVRSTTIRVW